MAKSSVAFFTFLLFLFVLAISDIRTVKAGLCERASKTWSGSCGNTRHCDDQCKAWEGAAHGACHVRGGKHMCFCYFPGNCAMTMNLDDKLEAEQVAQDKLKDEQLGGDKVEAKKVPNVEKP